MTKAVRVHKVGGPEVLTYESVEVPAPGPGEVRIRQHAVGLNFIDVYFRTGLYKAPGLPFIAGNEAAGEVLAVGPGVTNFHPGDRVACGSGIRETTTDRKITLSMPSTISSAVNVSSAAQASGLVSSSIMP